MKIKRILLAVLALIVFTGIALAQTNVVGTNAPPIGTGISALPSSVSEYWVLAIAAITPIIVGLIYKAVPQIPKLLLPASTPVLGILLGLIANAVSKAHLGWVDMAQAGALAVFVRETFNQAITQRMNPPATGPTVGTGTVVTSAGTH